MFQNSSELLPKKFPKVNAKKKQSGLCFLGLANIAVASML